MRRQQMALCDMWKSLSLWFCNCDLSHELKLVWICTGKISTSNLVTACVCFCDKSLRQNLNQPMRERPLLSSHVKFELVHISPSPNSPTCTLQVSCCSDLSQQQWRWADLSPCWVAAICRIVCLHLYREVAISWSSICQLFCILHIIRGLCFRCDSTDKWKLLRKKLLWLETICEV